LRGFHIPFVEPVARFALFQSGTVSTVLAAISFLISLCSWSFFQHDVQGCVYQEVRFFSLQFFFLFINVSKEFSAHQQFGSILSFSLPPPFQAGASLLEARIRVFRSCSHFLRWSTLRATVMPAIMPLPHPQR
jgi:hypothetical protein